MTIKETRPFGVPQELHERPIRDLLLELSGLKPDGLTPEQLALATVGITGYLDEGGWSVFAFDMDNPPTHPDETLGSFIEDDLSLKPKEVLAQADQWMRNSETTEWMPATVIHLNSDSNNVVGIVLVRAGMPTSKG